MEKDRITYSRDEYTEKTIPYRAMPEISSWHVKRCENYR